MTEVDGKEEETRRGRGNQPVRERRKKTASESERVRERVSAGDAAGRQANRTSATWSRPRWEELIDQHGGWMLARDASAFRFERLERRFNSKRDSSSERK
ncbi:hypothetical protein QLX08_010813 [Tetragonisca angustula]|uniref:Uncharacterized protein n=1 Tax=Tetragonisca angustula TaxID=166442 RepID=A0AAW0ZAU6_9HYME